MCFSCSYIAAFCLFHSCFSLLDSNELLVVHDLCFLDAKVPELIPSEEDYKRVKKIFTLDDDNVISVPLLFHFAPVMHYCSLCCDELEPTAYNAYSAKGKVKWSKSLRSLPTQDHCEPGTNNQLV